MNFYLQNGKFHSELLYELKMRIFLQMEAEINPQLISIIYLTWNETNDQTKVQANRITLFSTYHSKKTNKHESTHQIFCIIFIRPPTRAITRYPFCVP